jgi:recombination protein RecA
MDNSVLKRLKNAGLLSEQVQDLGFVSTGSYALNKAISGSYNKGIPVGMITQFHGESSSAKTVFATHILIEAQKKGYYAILIDSENAYSSDFAKKLGLNPKELIYSAPDTIEDCFSVIEDTILAIRETDKDTPIVIAYDSIAVSPSKAEFEADNYEGNNMQGAVRAKTTGACLRKMNPLMRKHKVALVVINQIRSKVGLVFGSPDTPAAGGKALDYYIGVNLKTISNKTSDLIKDDNKQVIGIQGRIRNTKNKVSLPFRECEFRLMFDEGLDPYYGLLDNLTMDGVLEKAGAWFTLVSSGAKFQKKDAVDNIKNNPEFASILELLK